MSKKYTREHEWIETVASGGYRIGVTDYAQEQLGDVVAVELPDVGRELSLNEECAVIESVKAASDIYSPIAGVITAVNESLNDNPALVNESPEADGWLWEMTLNDEGGLAALMDGEAYAKFIAESQ